MLSLPGFLPLPGFQPVKDPLQTSPPAPLLEGEGSMLPLPLGEGRGEGLEHVPST